MCTGKAERANACRATNIILALLAFSCQRAKGLPRNLRKAKPWRWQNTSNNNLTNLTIVPVKFHKTASSTLEAALRNSYGTHVHWSMPFDYHEEWLTGAGCFERCANGSIHNWVRARWREDCRAQKGSYMPTPFVIFVVVFRNPVDRLISAAHFSDWRGWIKINSRCGNLTRNEFDVLFKRTAESNSRPRVVGDFLAYQPYSEWLRVCNPSDAPRAIELLRDNFIVGVKENLTNFFEVITAVVRSIDAGAVHAAALHPSFSHVHEMPTYCQFPQLPMPIRAHLQEMTSLDQIIYEGAVQISNAQHAQVVETSFRRETIRLPTQSSRKLCRKTTASGVALVNSTLPAKSHGQSPLEVKRRNFCNVSETVNDQITPHLSYDRRSKSA